MDKFLSEAEQFKEENHYVDCIASVEKALKHEKEELMIIFEGKRLLCACYVKDEQTSEAIAACNAALEIAKEPNAFCDRAEAYLQVPNNSLNLSISLRTSECCFRAICLTTRSGTIRRR